MHRAPSQRMLYAAGFKQPSTCCHGHVRRSRGAIISAYIASTLLVLCWLMYTIHVTLKENEEDAEGGERPPRVSEMLRVGAPAQQFLTT